ncbi:Ig-like domain-containing protein [Burkholderia orbicola]|uniref:Ig-like domain-containing protein n=1 Tax=Burkholderia orbicola TaxID=2978683 RepID=UPI002659CBDB|nr:Ig-like domain-containing protein [Burkholderia orbicola]
MVIHDGDKAIGSTVADRSGNWAFTPGVPLADGEHAFTVTARDAAGNESEASQSFNVTIDTSGPGKTVITDVIDDVDPQTGSVSNGGYTNDTRPTLHGTAKPGSIVTIRDGDTVLGSTTADKSGNWRFTPDAAHALSEGTHSLTAQSKDSTGTEGDVSSTYVVKVDTTPPDAPVMTDVIDDFGDVTGSVGQGEATDDRRPTLKGTAEQNSIIVIYDVVNGTMVRLGSTQADAYGRWSFRTDSPLKNGTHEFQMVAYDAAGNASDWSNPYGITVLQGVPSAPSITGVTDAVEPLVGNVEPNGATNDAQPTVSGTAMPGQIVHVFIDGTEVGTAITTAAGQWSYRPTSPLPDGEHVFSAVAEGADGQMSTPTGNYPIVIDTVAPSASTNETLRDDVGPAMGQITNGTTTDDATPTYSGKAEAGALVTIYDRDKAIGSTVVNADGTWTFRPTEPLSDGAHSLSTTVTDKAGNVSGHGKPIDFTVDTTHVVITIDQVIDHVGSVQGALQSGQATDDRQPEIKGKATGSAIVKIYVDGQVVASVKAGVDGRWSLKLSDALSEGEHSITATSTKNGVESDATAPFKLTVDITPPDRPTIESVHDDVGAIQGPVANNGTTDDSTPTLKGHAERGSLVTIYDGGKAIGSTFADANGNWAFTPGRPLVDGTHAFTAAARDAAGNTSQASDPFTIHLDTSAPKQPAITEVIDAVGDVTGPLSQHDTTDDAQPLVKGTAEKNSLVLIYDTVFGMKVLIGSARADASGYWSFRPEAPVAPLADGDHHLTAVAMDAAGNESKPSGGFDFTVLVGGVPTAPSIAGVFDAVEPHVGNVEQSGVTNDAKATVMGTAPAGQIVHVFIDGNEVGTVKADATGRWWFRPDTPLADGEHRFTAIAETEGGEKSVETGAYTIVVDTTAPAVSTDQSLIDDVGAVTGEVVNGTVTDDATPTYSGKAEAGAIVTIYDGGKAIGSTVVKPDGTWHFHPTEPLSDGKHSFSTTVTDSAGNTSERSEAINFTVDTSSSGVIAIDEVIDNVGSIQGALQPGQRTDDREPVVNGHATPNSLVIVYVDGNAVGSTRADVNGTWSLKLPELSEGAHKVTATTTTAASGESKATEAFDLTVDTTAPGVSTNETVTDDVGSVTGPIKAGGVTDDATPTFSGKAEIGAIVTIYDGDKAIGSSVVNADGTWAFRPIEPLADGAHSLSTTVTDKAGNTSERSPSIGFTVDTTGAGVIIAIDEVIDHVGTVTGALQPGQTTDDERPEITGKATPNALVTVYVDGKAAGSVTAGADGSWSFRPDAALTEGAHRITATVTTPTTGESGQTEPFDLEIDTTPPAVSTNETVTDNVGSVTGPIKAGDVTDDATPTFSGKAETGAIVTIYDGDKAIGSSVVNADGTWTFRPTEPLADGAHNLSTTVTDRAGNTSGRSPSIGFTVDTSHVEISIGEVIDHVGTVKGALQPGQTTDDVRPEIAGKATPDSLVKVYVDGKVAGSVQAGSDGKWTLKLQEALSEGAHTITATSTTNNVESAHTASFGLTIDTTPPEKSTNETVTDDVGSVTGPIKAGGVTDDATPTFSGKAEIGAIVTIYDGDKAIGSSVVNADGTWTFRPTEPLADGKHSLSTTVTDKAGNTSARGDSIDFTVDTSGAGVITIETVTDHVGAVQGALQPGHSTDDTHPEIAGRATPNSLVKIYANGALVASVVASADGMWTVKVDTALKDGTYDITATTTTSASGESKPTGPFTLTVDTIAPDVSTNEKVTDHVGAVTGVIEAGGVTDDATPTFSGKAEPGAVVTIYDGDKAIGSSVVDADGTWSFRPTEPLADGEHSLSTTVTDKAGNTSERSPSVSFTVDTDGVGVSIAIDEVIDQAGTVTGALQPGQTTDDVHPEISGKATPDSLVKVYVDGKLAGSTTAGADGKWTLTLKTALTEGEHAITATTTTDASGESAQTEPFRFTVDLTPPEQPTIDGVTDDVGALQGKIANGGYTDDKTPTLSGNAEAGSIVTIYDGDTVLGSAVAAADGKWTFTPTVRLMDGEHSFTAIASDAAGNASAPSGKYTVHVDTVAPNSPGITQLIDDVGPVTGDVFKVGLTDDTMPMFSGKAEPGSIVTLYTDYEGERHVLGSARVTATGDWSIVPNDDMDDGVHHITMTATDKAGNVSATSEPYVLEIDTTAPAQPTITDMVEHVGGVTGSLGTDGGTTTDHQPHIVGLAEAGAMITVMTEDNGVLGTTYADATGRWEFAPGSALNDGVHVFSVTATDAAGNPSGRSTKVTITIESSQGGAAYSSEVKASTDALFSGEHDVASHASDSRALHGAHDSVNAGDALDASRDDAVHTARAQGPVQAGDVFAHVELRGEHSVLVADGEGRTLDLSDATVSGGIDAIDLAGSGANTLKLSLDDVLQHGGKDLFVDDGRTQLMVKGDARDVVDLSGSVGGPGNEWIAHGETTVDGVAYTVYENSAQNAELLVQHGVTTHLM